VNKVNQAPKSNQVGYLYTINSIKFFPPVRDRRGIDPEQKAQQIISPAGKSQKTPKIINLQY
jgi:hypothetical protein